MAKSLSKERLAVKSRLESVAFLAADHKFGQQALMILQGEPLEEIFGESWVEREVLRRFCALAEWHIKQRALGKGPRQRKTSVLTTLMAVQILENGLRSIYASIQKKK